MKPLNPNFWTRVAGRLQYRNLGWEESQVRHSVFPAYFNGEVDEPVLIYYEVYDCHSSGYVNDSLYQREECYIRPGDVVLDLGANIECSPKNLIDFSIMGSSLFNSLYPNDEAKVALLNIGSEELKGNEIIKETYQQLNKRTNNDFEFKGYIEGNQLMNGDVNVIVADGFTGNVALKTAEGTANFITSELKKTMTGNLIGKMSSLLNISNLKKFKKRLDPRLYNGAIFIGLDSPVIKSHGGTDYIGFSNSLSVCTRIVSGNLIEKIRKNIS